MQGLEIGDSQTVGAPQPRHLERKSAAEHKLLERTTTALAQSKLQTRFHTPGSLALTGHHQSSVLSVAPTVRGFVSANVPLPRAQHATPSPSLNPPPNRATIRTVGLLFLFGGSMCTPDQARDAIVRSANAWPRLSRGYFVGSRINTPSNTAHLASKPSAFAHMVSAPGLFATQKTFFGGPFLKPPSPTFSHARSARLHAEALSSSLVRASPRH